MKKIQIFIDTLSATCRLPMHEYFQVSGVSKSRLTDNTEKRIIIRGGISHTKYLRRSFLYNSNIGNSKKEG